MRPPPPSPRPLHRAVADPRSALDPARWDAQWGEAHQRLDDVRVRLGAPVWNRAPVGLGEADGALVTHLPSGDLNGSRPCAIATTASAPPPPPTGSPPSRGPRDTRTQSYPELREDFSAGVRALDGIPDSEARLRKQVLKLKELRAADAARLEELREDRQRLVRAVDQLVLANHRLRSTGIGPTGRLLGPPVRHGG